MVLAVWVTELSITGLTSNPTIFDHAMKKSQDYDAAIRQKIGEGKSGEALFFDLALEDITQAADLFRPVYEATDGVDGWVSLEVSPLLAYDAKSTRFAHVGVEYAALAAQLQREGAESFSASWKDLLDGIAAKSNLLTKTAGTRQKGNV
jgi:transaldolase